MLTVKEVCQRLGEAKERQPFGVTTVLSYINQGQLKAQKLASGMWVIEETDLKCFLEGEFAAKAHRVGRPRVKPLEPEQQYELRSGKLPHGNAGKKYRKRGQVDDVAE